MSPNFYALASVVCFSAASLVFGIYAKRISVLWMTAFKAVVALISFAIMGAIAKNWSHVPAMASFLALVLSGWVGLNIGDLFLVRAFSTIGSARALLIFSFQPIVLGTLGYLFFNQSVSPGKWIAILFLMSCVFILSLEKFHQEGRWDLRGPLFAVVGMLLDAVGIALTRYAFDFDPGISILEGNFYRCLGAVIGFAVLQPFLPLRLGSQFKLLASRSKGAILGASILGTTLSLAFYIAAVSRGQLATISAIVGSAPLYAGIWECLYLKKLPSKYLLVAFVLFGIGFSFLL